LAGLRLRSAVAVCAIASLSACSGEISSDARLSDGAAGSGGSLAENGNGGEPGTGGTPSLGAGGTGGTPSLGAGGMGGSTSAGGMGGGGFPGTGGSGGGEAGGTGGDPIDPPAGTVPMFVAQGQAGRTIISCDDGRTWVADRSDEAWGYCSDHDCDHGPGAGHGITWGDGWFFASFGWGAPGALKRSRDGVTWQSVIDGTQFGGVVFGDGRLVAADRQGRYSDDLGDTWRDFARVELDGWTVRSAGFVPYGGGRFIMYADNELVVSTDGSTWTKPSSIPAACKAGGYQGRILYGNGTIVMTPNDAPVCYSTDGGETWSTSPDAGFLRSNGVWTGSEFLAWSYGTVYRSVDGRNWTSSDTVPKDIDFGVTAISDTGTIVGVSSGWQQDYDAQVFYRSEDGVHWEALPSRDYVGGHPIRVIAFGHGRPSTQCPL